jgi:hypothetical protein
MESESLRPGSSGTMDGAAGSIVEVARFALTESVAGREFSIGLRVLWLPKQ